jgi:hypothetical protein
VYIDDDFLAPVTMSAQDKRSEVYLTPLDPEKPASSWNPLVGFVLLCFLRRKACKKKEYGSIEAIPSELKTHQSNHSHLRDDDLNYLMRWSAEKPKRRREDEPEATASSSASANTAKVPRKSDFESDVRTHLEKINTTLEAMQHALADRSDFDPLEYHEYMINNRFT